MALAICTIVVFSDCGWCVALTTLSGNREFDSRRFGTESDIEVDWTHVKRLVTGGRAALTFRLVPAMSQNSLQWKHVSVTSRTPIGKNGGSCEGRGVSNPVNIGSYRSERIENRTDQGDIVVYASWRFGCPTYWLFKLNISSGSWISNVSVF